ncbi:MAG: TraR/DksA family transcriptional regulator [Flavobacteriales bacterium]|jgi:DnaK suppressor protein|nr:TraR/DksA family transcriptional regulator [Flavobacteriales bacterium]HIK67795.1 TraR/DksA family transcriptional regulator [Flavobacteriales bacterium]
MLSEKDKIDIRERIELKMAEVSERIQEYKELTKPTPPSVAIGRVSRMDAINNRSINEAALRQLEVKLKGLESAIYRLNDDKFGRCLGCGEMIPIGRIILVPGATKCVSCS